MLELALCCVLSQKQMSKYSRIKAGTWKPATLTMALYHGNRDFLEDFFLSACLPAKLWTYMEQFVTATYSKHFGTLIFLLKFNSLVAKATLYCFLLHFASNFYFSISVHYSGPQFYSVTFYLF